VIGPGDAGDRECGVAREVGRLLAERGCVVLTGGLGGVMEAASRGARGAGGVVVAVLPGEDSAEANEHASVVVATGMGEARNAVVVNSADAVVAVGRGYGTLSEIGLALRAGKMVVGIRAWEVEGVVGARDAGEAVGLVLG